MEEERKSGSGREGKGSEGEREDVFHIPLVLSREGRLSGGSRRGGLV